MKKNASVFAAVMAITVLASLTVFTFAAVAPAAAPQTQALTDSVEDKIPVEPTSEPIPQNVSDRVIFANNSEIHAGEGSTIITDRTPTPTTAPTPAPTQEPTVEPTPTETSTPTPEPTATPQVTISFTQLGRNDTMLYPASYRYSNGTVVNASKSIIISVQIKINNPSKLAGTLELKNFYLEARDSNNEIVTLKVSQDLINQETVNLANTQRYTSSPLKMQIPENTATVSLKYYGVLPDYIIFL
jgi:hypothetical protein